MQIVEHYIDFPSKKTTQKIEETEKNLEIAEDFCIRIKNSHRNRGHGGLLRQISHVPKS